MKKSFLIAAVAALGLMTSCASIKHTADTAPVETKIVSFTVADLNTKGKKVSKTTSWAYNPFRRVNVNTEIKNTEAKLLQEADDDVLLEPQYIIEKRGFLRGGSVTVIGIPAKYTNFHKMTPDEAAIIGNACKEKCDKDKKERKRRWFLF